MSKDDIRNPHKKVDESWKDEVTAERGDDSERNHELDADSSEEVMEQGANFQLFLSTLAMQAYIALGELEDPVRKVVVQNLPQARYMIDLIGMLHEKTQGNLTPQEQNMINALLYELRMRFLQKTDPGALDNSPGSSENTSR